VRRIREKNYSTLKNIRRYSESPMYGKIEPLIDFVGKDTLGNQNSGV